MFNIASGTLFLIPLGNSIKISPKARLYRLAEARVVTIPKFTVRLFTSRDLVKAMEVVVVNRVELDNAAWLRRFVD